jgi:hypothetical protein
VQWRPDAPFTLDIAEFEHQLARADAATQAGHGLEQQSALIAAVDWSGCTICCTTLMKRSGVGSLLMNEAERRVSLRADQVGLGVGLTWDYGAAQILYNQRGYVPDGRGLFQQGKYLNYGEQICIDDALVLYLTKRYLFSPSPI